MEGFTELVNILARTRYVREDILASLLAMSASQNVATALMQNGADPRNINAVHRCAYANNASILSYLIDAGGWRDDQDALENIAWNALCTDSDGVEKLCVLTSAGWDASRSDLVRNIEMKMSDPVSCTIDITIKKHRMLCEAGCCVRRECTHPTSTPVHRPQKEESIVREKKSPSSAKRRVGPGSYILRTAPVANTINRLDPIHRPNVKQCSFAMCWLCKASLILALPALTVHFLHAGV